MVTRSIQQPTSPIKDLNGKCVFINHKFLFNFFSFRNSQYIDLFPVFIKDILPFTLTKTKSKFISQVYDEVKMEFSEKEIVHILQLIIRIKLKSLIMK